MYTLKDKSRRIKIEGVTSNFPNSKIWQWIEILQFKFTRINRETPRTNVNWFQLWAIDNMKWTRLAIFCAVFSSREWILSDLQYFQAIQPINPECIHRTESVVSNFNRFNKYELGKVNCGKDLFIASIFRYLDSRLVYRNWINKTMISAILYYISKNERSVYSLFTCIHYYQLTWVGLSRMTGVNQLTPAWGCLVHICISWILERTTARGFKKLAPREKIDSRLGRSK